MGGVRMHADEVDTSVELVCGLLREQFPEWAGEPVTLVESYGTDHDIYRIGKHLSARLPRIGWATKQAEKERTWLPRLAPHLPLALPVQVATGRPGADYPFDWSIYEWLPGAPANGSITDPDQAATDLAGFVAALRRIDTTDAYPRPEGARGAPLAELDSGVRRAIAELGDRIDGTLALRAWEASLNAPAWDGAPVWLHGDLLPGNILVVDGKLSAVIDFGTLNVGDPACDLQPAWHLFTSTARERFIAALGTDEASRLRGRGWVLCQALIALPYYWDTNPGIVRQSLYALSQVLEEG